MRDTAQILADIEAYKQAWSARMDAGYFGAVLPEEEGARYADAAIVDGKMLLVCDES